MTRLAERISKKEQIASLYRLGITTIEELASLTKASPSYVATVLREGKVLQGYFDLYTSTQRPMNVYSKFFAGRLGFKDTATAQKSVQYLNEMYRQFERTGDRAGQHHALYLALTMRNRALWAHKVVEAAIFSQWLVAELNTLPLVDHSPPLSP